jgi:hypothetical protein
MSETLNVTLIAENGDEHPTVLREISGPLDQSGWKGLLEIRPSDTNPKLDATLRIDGGDRDGFVAQVQFVDMPGGAAVLGLTGFAPVRGRWASS